MTMTRERLYRIVSNSDPSDEVASWYNRVMSVVILTSLIPLCFKETPRVFEVLESVCLVAFVIDYILCWVTADFAHGKGRASFIIHPFTPMAIVDLLSMLPFFFTLNQSLRAVRILRLLRALRAFRLVRNSRGMVAVAKALSKKREQLLAVVAVAVGWVLASALVIFNVEPQSFNTFFDAIYWAVITLTTVGYGDLYPVSSIGRIVAILSSFIGIAVIAMPAGIITAGMMEAIAERTDASKGDDPENPERLSS